MIFQNCLKFHPPNGSEIGNRKLRITILKHHSWYLCQISLQIMLLPILIFLFQLFLLTVAFFNFFQALRVLLFGTPYTSFNSDWRKQHINFFTNMSYALSFYKVNLILKALELFLPVCTGNRNSVFRKSD